MRHLWLLSGWAVVSNLEITLWSWKLVYVSFFLLIKANALRTLKPQTIITATLCSYFNHVLPKEMQKVSALEESRERKKYVSVSEVLTYCCIHSVCSSLSLVSCSWCEEEVCHVYTLCCTVRDRLCVYFELLHIHSLYCY